MTFRIVNRVKSTVLGHAFLMPRRIDVSALQVIDLRGTTRISYTSVHSAAEAGNLVSLIFQSRTIGNLECSLANGKSALKARI